MKEKKIFKIRQTNDIDAVKSLHSQTFPHDDWYESSYEVIYWLVFDSKGKEVGFCMLSLLTDGISFLARVGVLPEARGHNLQKRLLRVREAYAKRKNFTKVITYTTINNIASMHNLQKAGYFLYLPENCYAGDEFLYWIKDLK